MRALSVFVSGPGAVRSASLASPCRGSCRVELPSGSAVRLEAAADSNGQLQAWSGACSGSATCDVVLSSDAAVSATFVPIIDTLTVRIRGTGRGRVVSTPAGLQCASGATCTLKVPRDAEVRLQATPDALSKLDFWSGLCAKEPCTFKMHGDAAVDASFAMRRYTVVDLGMLSGDWWNGAVAISAHGEVVAGNAGGPGRPMLLNPTLQALGIDRGWVSGVTSSRMVAGNFVAMADAAGNPIYHPFRWSKGVVTDLAPLSGGPYAVATGMNDSGTVVGYSAYDAGPSRAVYWNDAGAIDLGSLGDTWFACSSAFGINRAGLIVGQTCTRLFALHAARFRAPGVIDDLGTLGGNQSRANAVNDAGDIVGFSDLPQGNGAHGFFWRNGVMDDAGALPGDSNSQLEAVNSQGVAVGLSHDANEWPTTGVVYLEGRMIAMDDLVDDVRGIHVTEVSGIDDANTMVGAANIFGMTRAILLRAK